MTISGASLTPLVPCSFNIPSYDETTFRSLFYRAGNSDIKSASAGCCHLGAGGFHWASFVRLARVGRFGNEFNILKFRTMVTGSESLGPKITVGKDPRITRSGHFLRKCKLDELPQLFNVVKGDMSLVGPRPEVPEYVAIYPQKLRAKIFSDRPGITDLSSLEYRDEGVMLTKSADPAKAYVEECVARQTCLL